MAKNKQLGWLGTLGLNIFASGVVVAIGYYYASQNISSMIAKGVEILNVHDASNSLDEIMDSCQSASIVLGESKERPAKNMVGNLRDSFRQLSKAIDEVKQTEMYSTAEIKSLAKSMTYDTEQKAIIDRHLGKPKRIVNGLPKVKIRLGGILQLLEDLDRQLDREPAIDIDSIRQLLSNVQTLASTAQAGLESRQAATLETLASFDSAKDRNRKINN